MTDAIYNSWSEDHELILKQIAEKAACYRYINFESYNHYKKVDQRFALPVIVLSTLAGSASLGSGNVPTYAAYITIGSALINIITGILGTLQKFLNTADLTTHHFTASVEYGRLSREIGIMLNLPKQERTQEGPKFLEYAKSDYNRLVDSTPAPPGFILREFEKKFSTNELAKPDLISLVPININTKKNKAKGQQPILPITNSSSQRNTTELELNAIRKQISTKNNKFKNNYEDNISQVHEVPNHIIKDITLKELRQKYETTEPIEDENE
jgi:hypothetical protein